MMINYCFFYKEIFYSIVQNIFYKISRIPNIFFIADHDHYFASNIPTRYYETSEIKSKNKQACV